MRLAAGRLPPRLVALLQHDNCRRVKLQRDGALAMFVIVNGAGEVVRRCRGITRVLRRAFPVAELARKQRPRAGYLIRANTAAQCVPNAREHGIVIDRQLGEYIRLGARRFAALKRIDPCVASLLHHIRVTRRWVPVAAQVPMTAPSLGQFATACDLLCTDAATRSELHLIEIKATRAAFSAEAFERTTAYASGPLRGMPLGRYTQAQLQAWLMRYALVKDCATPLDSVEVWRVAPGRVDVYPLNNWFDAREKALINRVRAVVKRPG